MRQSEGGAKQKPPPRPPKGSKGPRFKDTHVDVAGVDDWRGTRGKMIKDGFLEMPAVAARVRKPKPAGKGFPSPPTGMRAGASRTYSAVAKTGARKASPASVAKAKKK